MIFDNRGKKKGKMRKNRIKEHRIMAGYPPGRLEHIIIIHAPHFHFLSPSDFLHFQAKSKHYMAAAIHSHGVLVLLHVAHCSIFKYKKRD